MDPKELEARRAALAELLENPQPDTDIDATITEADEVRQQIDTYNAQVEKANEARARLATSTLARPTPGRSDVPTEPTDPPEPAPALDKRAMVRSFVESRQLAEYREHGVGRGGRGGMAFEGIEARALVTNTVAAPLSQTTRLPGMVNLVEDRPLRIADIITTVPVSGNAVEYVRDNSSTPQGAAAEVLEGANTKPESTYTWEVITDSIKTVAHWMDITRQALDDQPQLQGLAQGRLFYGLGYRVDNQIINGTGSSNTITGILATSGINAYDIGASNTEAKVVSLRRAKTLVRKDEYAANVAVLNPDDWETIELSVDDTARWRVTTNPQESLSQRIWGMTVIDTQAIAAGTALIGDFKLGATLYDRQQAALYVTDSDASKFLQNILTLLAELRLGLGVNRPSAFAKITFRGDE